MHGVDFERLRLGRPTTFERKVRPVRLTFEGRGRGDCYGNPPRGIDGTAQPRRAGSHGRFELQVASMRRGMTRVWEKIEHCGIPNLSSLISAPVAAIRSVARLVRAGHARGLGPIAFTGNRTANRHSR